MAKFKFTYYGRDGGAQYGVFGVVEAGMTAADRLLICRRGAEVLIQRLREFLAANTFDKNARIRGRLAESLTAREFASIGSVIVSPEGKHHGSYAKRKRSEGYRRAKTGLGRGRSNKSLHHGMTGGVSAQDVGYYLEYGTPRMAPLHWMETVCEQSGDEVQAAMEQAFDEYLASKGF